MSQYDSLSNLNDRMLQRVDGVYIGIVTNTNDPDKLGRVKVKIPVLDDKAETDWIRMAVLAAGDNRGTVFIPDVGAEVLVAFVLGDLRQPIVIGVLWNNKQKPPRTDKKEAPYLIRSRKGHEIMLDDDSSESKILLKTSGGHQIELSDKESSVEIQDKSGQQKITMKNGSFEIVSGQAKVTIRNNNVTIETPTNIQIKGTKIDIEASAAMEIKANGTLKLTSSGLVELKGTMVKIN